MAQGLNKVKKRIQTVESTKKITSAMKLVSSVKFSQLQKEYENRTLYFNGLKEYASIVFSACEGKYVSSLYLDNNFSSKKTLYVVVSSSLGLCGAYNYNVYKYLNNIYKEGDEILTIGTSIFNTLKNDESVKIDPTFTNIIDELSMSNCRILANYLLKKYETKEYKKVVLLYTTYQNAISFQVTKLKLLPVSYEESRKDLLNPGDLEPSLDVFLDRFVRKYLTSALYIKLFDSFLSEQASRRNAMENADKNAEDLVEKLKLEFNKARQTSITQEINEVVSGSLNK